MGTKKKSPDISKNTSRSTSGAVASNAGDDFHFQWGAQQLISLLNTKTDLTAVSVEDPSSFDIEKYDASELLAGDLYLYYGGSTFESCDKVELQQLKYAVSPKDKTWTKAKLLNKVRGKSVWSKFASAYLEFEKKHGKSKTQDKFTIRLISNFPVSNEIITLVNLASEYVSTGNNLSRFNTKLSSAQKTLSNSLKGGTTINTIKDFVLFLSSLKLDGKGSPSRLMQSLEAKVELNSYLTGFYEETFFKLVDLIRKMASPEGMEASHRSLK
ncbi:MAG: hypothetical protein ACI9SQ_001211 [Rubritalea sp.]|jgi:hypothetical protein